MTKPDADPPRNAEGLVAGGPPEGHPVKGRWMDRAKRYQLHALAVYLIAAVAGLILLRVLVRELDFLGVGWIVALVAIPLLPWLIPRFGEFVKTISPYVQSVTVGNLQIDLREAQRTPISIAAAGMQPGLPNDFSALSDGTSISILLNALRELEQQGGSPVAIIDLQDGRKWRLPNLYFLARLLELDPVVRELIFTESRGGVDGYFVGSAVPDEVRRRIEQALPAYAAAAATLPRRYVPTLADVNIAQPVAMDFRAFHSSLGADSGQDDDPLFGYLTSGRLAQVGGPLSSAAVEGLGTALAEGQLRDIVSSPCQFVPATTNGRVTGVLDRDAVALAVARSALANR